MEKKILSDFAFPAKTIILQAYNYDDDADADDLKNWEVKNRQRLSMFFKLLFFSIALVLLYLWITSDTDNVLRKICSDPPEFLVHNIRRPPLSSIRRTNINDYIARSMAENGDVEYGGRWLPHDCLPRQQTVVIIPFLGDNFQLWTLLRHMHPLLKRQKHHYQVFVVENLNQSSSSDGTMRNAGQVLNAAAEQAEYKAMNYNNICLIFHYPSILPATDEEYFGCTEGTVKIFAENRAGFIIGMFAEDFDLLGGFSENADEPSMLIEDLRTEAALNQLLVESRRMRYHSMNQDSNKMTSARQPIPDEVNLQFERSRRLFTHLAVST